MPISCHFQDCKALLVLSPFHVISAIASVGLYLYLYLQPLLLPGQTTDSLHDIRYLKIVQIRMQSQYGWRKSVYVTVMMLAVSHKTRQARYWLLCVIHIFANNWLLFKILPPVRFAGNLWLLFSCTLNVSLLCFVHFHWNYTDRNQINGRNMWRRQISWEYRETCTEPTNSVRHQLVKRYTLLQLFGTVFRRDFA